ncbi:Lsr2 family protein [Agromyces sp. Marseille-P2726]|uniref:histone-like nucleoid-structuring protein Lsr2 n=1 Tax=Agromyces sp. Marseille-P2726 TaxID=2709132 RepID=UPI00156D8E05|nr:Lsr2 family protein [Agromyces sp. Marseille-P2726]
MSKKTVVTLIDDIDGTEAAETITFTLDGKSYEIDLSADNAANFRSALAPYTAVARRTARRSARRGVSSSGATLKEIRAWAADHGIVVPARGRIPADVQEQYRAAIGLASRQSVRR